MDVGYSPKSGCLRSDLKGTLCIADDGNGLIGRRSHFQSGNFFPIEEDIFFALEQGRNYLIREST